MNRNGKAVRLTVKARIEKILPPTAASFVYRIKREPGFSPFWHYHPEYQLTLVLRGRGKRFVGDNVAAFKPGDLVLTGPDLPHMWCSSQPPGRGGPHEAVMVQFSESIFGGRFLELPEMASVRRLLDRSVQGIRFGDAVRRSVGPRVLRMGRKRGLPRLIELLEILRILSQAPAERPLSSRSFSSSLRSSDRQRIDAICRFTTERAAGPVSLSQAAAAAHMSVPAFTRFFRRCTGKTFVEYLTELRVGSACRLLVETDRTVTEVCFAAGFNNVSTFNRRFRELKGTTPRDFRNQFSP
jgi:AraC-like DNA-binding protein